MRLIRNNHNLTMNQWTKCPFKMESSKDIFLNMRESESIQEQRIKCSMLPDYSDGFITLSQMNLISEMLDITAATDEQIKFIKIELINRVTYQRADEIIAMLIQLKYDCGTRGATQVVAEIRKKL